MVELKVISHISKQLNDFTTKVFALWNEADPVYIHIIGVDADVRDAYLRQELEAIEIFEDIPRLDKIQVRSYILRTGLLTEKRLDQYIRINKSEPNPDSQPGKAKKTRQEDAAAILDKTIEKVCNLLNGTVVKYDNNRIHWVFKGNAAQYAYFALKLKKLHRRIHYPLGISQRAGHLRYL